MNLKIFGKLPKGERLEKIKASPNYKNNEFQNQSFTATFAEGVTYYKAMRDMICEKSERLLPKTEIPTEKFDLKNLDLTENILVWFGHSSYFLQIDRVRILVDPVLTGKASPIPFGGTKSFLGSNNYFPEDIPEIDYLFISHDHWDHLDYETIMIIKPCVKTVLCGLGVGEHLEFWGYNPSQIIEKDWYDEVKFPEGITVNIMPGRHFSGRGLVRNKSLWVSFVVQTPTMRLFLGGDSGYDKHFKEIGDKFGPFDLAIIENGQYNENWKHIHLMPSEQMTVAKELKAKCVFPVHSSKFALASHAWDEPLQLISENAKKAGIKLITPKIGEKVRLNSEPQIFSEWWKNVD